MKKKYLPAPWIIALAVGWTWMGPSVQAEERAPPSAASQRAALFTETVRHLEMDGDVLVFLNTRNLFRNAMLQVQDLVRLLAETDTELAPASRVLATIGEFLDESGFYDAWSLGLSFVPRDDGLHRVRAFVGRDPAGADRALWRTLGGAPGTLEGVRLLPRDTIWVQDCNLDWNEAWRLLRRAVERIGGPQHLAAMDDHLRSVQQNTAFDLPGLLAALSDEHFVSFQFSEDKTVTFSGEEPPLSLPEPAFLIGFSLRNTSVPDAVLHDIFKHGPPVDRIEKEGQTIFTLEVPLPLPFPVTLSLARHKNWLLLASNPERLVEAIRTAESGKGLIDTPDFQRFTADHPQRINGLTFVHPRLSQITKQLQQHVAGSQPNATASSIEVMRNLSERFPPCAGAVVRVNEPTGIWIVGTTSQSGRQVMAALTAGPIGLLAAVAVPSFVQARTRAQQIGCINNLRAIELAKEQWMLEHGKKDGDTVTADDLAPYLPKGMPACPRGGTYMIQPIGRSPTCTGPGHMLGE